MGTVVNQLSGVERMPAVSMTFLYFLKQAWSATGRESKGYLQARAINKAAIPA